MLDKPITFTRVDEAGKEWTKIAYTPADVVKMRFDGWKEVPEAEPAAKADADKTGDADKGPAAAKTKPAGDTAASK